MVYINLITSCFYIYFTSTISSLFCTQAKPDTSTYVKLSHEIYNIITADTPNFRQDVSQDMQYHYI